MTEETSYQQIAIGSYIAQAGPGATAIVNVFHQAPPRQITPDELAAAEQQLAQLPLAAIPEPAAYPAFSRMPLLRNPLFVGREAELKTLAAVLKGGQTAAIGQVAAATGLGESARANWRRSLSTATANISRAGFSGSASPTRRPSRRRSPPVGAAGQGA